MKREEKIVELSSLCDQVFRFEHEKECHSPSIHVAIKDEFSIVGVGEYVTAFMKKRGFLSSQVRVHIQNEQREIVFFIEPSLIKEQDIQRLIKAIRTCLHIMATSKEFVLNDMVG